MSQVRKTCKSCRKSKLIDEQYKSCTECRHRSSMNKALARDNKVKCCAKRKDGSKCENGVKKDYGNKYCALHKGRWEEEKQTKGKIVKRCTSNISCDPENPGKPKAILPENYQKAFCESCLKRTNEKDRERREKRKIDNDKLLEKGSSMRQCLKCPSGKLHKEKDMGLRNDGTRSDLCKKHFELSQKEDYKRRKRKQIKKISKNKSGSKTVKKSSNKSGSKSAKKSSDKSESKNNKKSKSAEKSALKSRKIIEV